MSVQVKRRREAASFLSTFVGAQAELLVDTTNNRLQVHDGATPGGWPAARLSETQTIGRTLVDDASYSILATDVLVSVVALTTSRTLTLPASSAYPSGRVLRVLDESGAASANLQIVVATAGSDLIDDAASTAIETPFGSLELLSNGGGKWFMLQDVVTSLGELAALGINAPADPTNPFSATLNSALFNALGASASGSGDVRVKLNKQSPANTASFQFQDAFAGRAEIGLCGDDSLHVKVSPDGSTWKDALRVDASTGALSAAAAIQTPGLNGGALAGHRNRVVNGDFAINQRGCASGVALNAGAYGFDRWKAGASGAALTFAAGQPDTSVTIASGSLAQVVEGVNVEGGAYVLSWAGTAQARIYQGAPAGSFAAAPVFVSGLAAGVDVTVEFGAGSLGCVQVEPGAVVTPFERRPLSLELDLCLRYYQTFGFHGGTGLATNEMRAFVPWRVPMRATPTMTLSNLEVYTASGWVVPQNAGFHTFDASGFTLWAAHGAASFVWIGSSTNFTPNSFETCGVIGDAEL